MSSDPPSPGTPPTGGAGRYTPTTASRPQEDLSGDRLLAILPRDGQGRPVLGGFALICRIGRGGMGAVYYAIHPRLAVEVAVKILPFTLVEQDPRLADRFHSEGRMAAALRSDHIVHVLDVNQDHDTHFLVMEYVDGESAGGHIKGQKTGLSERDALAIVLAATQGLSVAHAKGIIHRDIKPDNILIPREAGGLAFAKAKLADLGLAKPEGSGQSVGTQSHVAMGTPGYMAPEQIEDAKTAGPPADVFSMGATLYALLSGHAPFVGSSLGVILRDTATKEPPPLPAGVSVATKALVERCMAKDPKQRYANGAALLRALETGGLGPEGAERVEAPSTKLPGATEPTLVAARDVSPPERKRSRVPMIAAIAAAAVLVIVAVAYLATRGPGKSAGEEKATSGMTAEQRREAYQGYLTAAEIAKTTAEVTDTADAWQKVAAAAAKAELNASGERETRAAHDLAALAAQRIAWATAREVEERDLDAAIALVARAMAAREAPKELTDYQAALAAKKREREDAAARKSQFDQLAAQARTEKEPAAALALWRRVQRLADQEGDKSEAAKRVDELSAEVRYAAAMAEAKAAEAVRDWERARAAYERALEAKRDDAAATAALAEVRKRVQPGKVAIVSATFDARAGKVALKVTIEPGWHIYSVRPAKDVSPTTIALEKGFAAEGVIEEPKPLHRSEQGFEFDCHEGAVTFLIPARIAADTKEIKGTIDFMAFDANQCLAKTLSFTAVPGVVEVAQPEEPAKIEIVLDAEKKIRMEFVRIKAGMFIMGDKEKEDAPHEVTLTKDYWMQTTETTQAQWEAVMGWNESKFKGPDLPVEQVSWDICQKFMEKLTAKAKEQLKGKTASLPTEAEWEYACRAGSKERFSFGEDESTLGDYAWYDKNSGSKTHAVAQKKPNAWGLYDMHGNVREWCQDWHGEYGGKASDPPGPSSGTYRVLRGGSGRYGPTSARSAGRYWGSPGYGRHEDTGLRVALHVAPDFKAAFNKLAEKGLQAATGEEAGDLVELLEKGRRQEALPFLAERLLRAEKVEERFLAALMLERLKDPAAVPALSESLKSEPEELARRMSAHALAIIGTDAAREPLRKAMAADKDWGVRLNSAYGLAKLGDGPGLQFLQDAYATGPAEYRVAVLGGLAEIAAPSTVTFFREILNDTTDATELILAINALAAMKDEGALPQLQRIAGSAASQGVRDAAAKAVAQIKKDVDTFVLVLDADKKIKMEFVRIKAGTFTMGDKGEKDATPHEVTLTKDYWMQTTETTQAQWEAVMGSNPSDFKGADLPVEQVSWEDCQKFMEKLNAKAKEQLKGKAASLPTEAEWEYACRAGSKDKWSFGDDESKLVDYAWYSKNSVGKTHAVAQKKPNAWGLHDMTGNVYEWCQDWYGGYGGKATDPTGPGSGTSRVLRGGTWAHLATDLYSANRDRVVPAGHNSLIGLRVALH